MRTHEEWHWKQPPPALVGSVEEPSASPPQCCPSCDCAGLSETHSLAEDALLDRVRGDPCIDVPALGDLVPVGSTRLRTRRTCASVRAQPDRSYKIGRELPKRSPRMSVVHPSQGGRARPTPASRRRSPVDSP
jgi:hypothetical protein